MPKIGDVYENAIWADGTETPDLVERFRRDCEKAFRRKAKRERVIIGKVRVEEKQPNEDRVPPVPDDIQGPNVRLLVAWAPVTMYRA